MYGLPQSTLILVLGMLDAHPERTPERFDQLQRELGAWFERGGSCRSFVESRGGTWRV